MVLVFHPSTQNALGMFSSAKRLSYSFFCSFFGSVIQECSKGVRHPGSLFFATNIKCNGQLGSEVQVLCVCVYVQFESGKGSSVRRNTRTHGWLGFILVSSTPLGRFSEDGSLLSLTMHTATGLAG